MFAFVSFFKDIVAFLFLFVLVIAAFIVGFHTLYWYYYPHTTEQIRDAAPDSNTDDEGFER